ncbi:hypothetical protein [Rhizobium sp. RU36D]|uniref:hypothetical protein n=1 Tax=Rhizobium sp. RU36D TaxID=1907415 RepID=UPI0009D86065|nr:hypothetical protein [Rhizobium sp. RU36D]SMC97112.1 hypothetical protein SAMN05880593_112141 [Rhizobium sp. RU36D]
MADIVRIMDRMTKRPTRPDKTPVVAEILMFTGVRYEAPSGWLKPTEIVTGALTGGPLQLGGPAEDPKPC